jgi:glycosyltransferase involved in cell wall biosynthesis
MIICHVVYECVPGSFVGGVQKMVYEFGLAQSAQGDRVEIWTVGLGPDIELNDRLRIRYFPGRVQWSSPALCRALVAEHRRFDIIHSHNTFLPLNRAVAQAALGGAKVFFHAHGALDPQFLRGAAVRAWKKRIYNRLFERPNFNAAAGVFGLTKEECRQLVAFGTKTRIYEVGNGIVPAGPLQAVDGVAFRLRQQIAPTAPVLLFVGRITHKKGVHYLVDALARVRREIPNAVLVLAGGRDMDRPYVATLDRQIAALGVQDAVRWVGFLDEREKRSAFAAATVFFHASYSEGMALAILEAMSFGVPTIVTPGCYMDEAVEAGALCLAEQSAAGLAQAALRLLRDPAAGRELGRRAQERICRHHGWGAIAARLREIYLDSDRAERPFRDRLVN